MAQVTGEALNIGGSPAGSVAVEPENESMKL
jgi:hypothetical protein